MVRHKNDKPMRLGLLCGHGAAALLTRSWCLVLLFVLFDALDGAELVVQVLKGHSAYQAGPTQPTASTQWANRRGTSEG